MTQEIDKILLKDMLDALRECSAEITRVNMAAGETVFNPTATSMVRDVLGRFGIR